VALRGKFDTALLTHTRFGNSGVLGNGSKFATVEASELRLDRRLVPLAAAGTGACVAPRIRRLHASTRDEQLGR